MDKKNSEVGKTSWSRHSSEIKPGTLKINTCYLQTWSLEEEKWAKDMKILSPPPQKKKYTNTHTKHFQDP